MEAVVLAGGLGTRIASVLPQSPKILAPIGSRTLLEIQLDRLLHFGFERVILSLGFRADQVLERFGDKFGALELIYSIEQEQLGTGGATRKAFELASEDSLYVFNGDTMVDLDPRKLLAFHHEHRSLITIAATSVPDCQRYGRLVIDGDQIIAFAEKGRSGPGWISAGAYAMSRDVFSGFDLPQTFSLEHDFFSPLLGKLNPLAWKTAGYFIDVGIPEDLAQAQNKFGRSGEQF